MIKLKSTLFYGTECIELQQRDMTKNKRQRFNISRFSSPITVDLPERKLWEDEDQESSSEEELF